MSSPGDKTSLVERQGSDDQLGQTVGGPVGSILGTGDAPTSGQGLSQSNLGDNTTGEVDLQEVLVEALEGVAAFRNGRKEVRGCGSGIQNEGGTGPEFICVSDTTCMSPRVVDRNCCPVTSHQGCDVVGTTGSAVPPGLSWEADRSGVLDVITDEDDTQIIERRNVVRIGGEYRRRVTDACVVDIAVELEGHRDRRVMG